MTSSERQKMREAFARMSKGQPHWHHVTMLHKLWDKRPVGVSVHEMMEIALEFEREE
jgi:hypothetical protein